MKRLCAEPGCNQITDGKRCPKHTKTGWQKTDQHRPGASARGYGSTWKTIRDAFIAAHPTCQCPGYGKCIHPQGCVARSTDVDHVKRRQDRVRDGEPPDSTDNLQALCGPCHTQKTLFEVHGGVGGHPEPRSLKP